MKNKIIVLITIFTLLFLVAGCKKEETIKKDDNNSIILEDVNKGFKTTFSYPKNFKYEVKDITGGKYKEITIDNEKNNIAFDMYYFEILDSSYIGAMDTRKNSDGFKEYKWGNYDGYIYNVSKTSLNVNILLRKETKKKKAVGIFIEVSPIKYKDADVLELFNSKDIQNLLNSIVFEEK